MCCSYHDLTRSSGLHRLPHIVAGSIPVPDQSAATITRLLVEEIVSRHGVPTEVFCDRGHEGKLSLS